jgi:DNA-nicking Smr family endonuclease
VVSSEEAKLWRDAMRDAKEFVRRAPMESAETPSAPAPPASSAPPVRSRPAEGATKSPPPPAPPPAVRIHISPAPRNPTTPLLDHRRAPGLDKSTAGRFAKGSMEIDATIDLHGLTQPVAHAALARFVVGSADMGRRCVLVITGKGNRDGTGVLRAEVPRWLNEPGLRGQILAFTYAQPKHGGEGALYVLLKRRR